MIKAGLTFSEEQFNRLFPFFILLNPDLTLRAFGKSLAKMAKLGVNEPFNEHFSVKRPSIATPDLEGLAALNEELVILEYTGNRPFQLRGQFEKFPHSTQLLFLGSPWFDSMENVQSFNLQVRDFAFHDPMIDLLHVLKSLEITNEESKELISTINAQRKNLQAISKELRDYALFPMQNPHPLVRVSTEGKIIMMNPAAQAIHRFNYKNKVMDHESFWAEVAGDLRNNILEGNVEAVSDGKIFSFVCIRLPEHGYTNIYGRDVTEDKKRQKELLELSSVVMANEGGIVMTDLEGKITWVNEGFLKMTGYSREETVGKTPVQLCAGKLTDPAALQDIITRFRSLQSYDVELVHYKKDGSWFWGRSKAQPMLDQHGVVYHYFAMIEDVTSTRLEQEKVKVLSSIVEDNINAVIMTDPKGRITWVNKSFTQLTGYTLEEARGNKPGHMLQGKETSPAAKEYLSRQIKSGEPFQTEILNYKKSGEPYWLRIQGQPIHNKDGHLSGFFAIEEDITTEKELTRKIRESEELFLSALNKIGDNIWEHDYRTERSKFSQLSLAFLGLETGDNPTKLWWGHTHPEDRAILQINDLNYRSGKIRNHSLEYRMLNNMGQIKWVLDRGVVVEESPDGKPLRIIGTHTDITHIKQTEIELANRVKQFKNLSDNLPGVLYEYEFRPDGTEGFRYVSKSYKNVVGLPIPEIEEIGKYLDPQDLQEFAQKSAYSRHTLEPFEFESRIIIPGRPIRWHHSASNYTYTEEDGTHVFTGYMQDITEKKKAEEILKTNEEKYRSIITNMKLGLIELDTDNKISFANQCFSDMSGYPMDELVGSKPSELMKITEDDNRKMKEKIMSRQSGVSDSYELQVFDKSGTKKWWLISGGPKYNTGGEYQGTIGIHLDITYQKQLQEELMETTRRAERLAKVKENFLANMSHEIRTPMNAIIGMSTQLGKTTLNSQQQFYLSTIHSAADNLLVVINDILDLSKIEAGKLSLENIGFVLSLAVERSMVVLLHKAEEKGLTLTNSLLDKRIAPVLIGDPYRLNQILLNLISNAIKFTEVGSVDLKVELIEDLEKAQLVRFMIIDTGIGMDEEFISHLFEKFSQEYHSNARKYGGTGLGMSICKDLVNLMGGQIMVESEKGKGSTFTFEIRFEKGKQSDLRQKMVEGNRSAIHGKVILVIDDNDMNRLVASTTLRGNGADVIEASNGKDAIEQLAAKQVDLVLMDIQMPGISGFEATRLIREGGSHIPIIAMTANAFKGEREKCIQAGMNDYLAKPFREEDLLNVIANCLGQGEEMPTVEPGQPVGYSLTYLRSLSRGNEEFVKKMISLFCEQAPAITRQMSEAYETGDVHTVGSLAHKLKPSIDNLCIEELRDVIRQIEKGAREINAPEQLAFQIRFTEETITKVVREMGY